MGVVLHELLRCSNKYQGLSSNLRYLFKGKSCYPISPANTDVPDEVHQSDQIFKILERYPKTIEEQEKDFSFISSEVGKDYIKEIIKTVQVTENVENIYENSNAELR